MLSPKHRSRTKKRNPLLQHTKARGFLFVVVKFTGGVEFLRRQRLLIRSLRLAQISGFNSPTRRGLMLMFGGISGVLMALIQEIWAKVKPLSVATQTRACCAHGSARFALQGSRRVRPRWELALFDKSRTNRPRKSCRK